MSCSHITKVRFRRVSFINNIKELNDDDDDDDDDDDGDDDDDDDDENKLYTAEILTCFRIQLDFRSGYVLAKDV